MQGQLRGIRMYELLDDCKPPRSLASAIPRLPTKAFDGRGNYTSVSQKAHFTRSNTTRSIDSGRIHIVTARYQRTRQVLLDALGSVPSEGQ